MNDAENGVLPALKFLGDIYLDGYEEESIEPDLQKSMAFYEKAAKGGMEEAFYSDYWGVDASGKICELVVIFMNPELFWGYICLSCRF